jgi:ABC-2 type transport system ATP-binding protein
MGAIVETFGLTKQYRQLTAVNDLRLTVDEGAVYGFVGPNGAGKTTTLRILATLLRATEGEARVAGYSVRDRPNEVRRVIGYMPDFFGVYGDMRVWEFMDFFAACFNIPSSRRRPLVQDLLKLVELDHRRDDYVDGLSRGMKQRLCLARALVHDPEVMILDEPASGLDPRARVEVRELLRELHTMGKTILVSSHILTEVEDICTHIGIIEAGQLVATGTLEEMRQLIRAHRTVRIGLLDKQDIELAIAWLKEQPQVLGVDRVSGNGEGDLEVTFAGDDRAIAELLAAMVKQRLLVVLFHEQSGDLEDIFMRLTKGIVS